VERVILTHLLDELIVGETIGPFWTRRVEILVRGKKWAIDNGALDSI